ncbi:MAG: hypothetical protein RL068_839 [Actinomycetota bacterium]|jgi:tight adherence protein B
MSKASRFVALATAGVSLKNARDQSGISETDRSPIAILISDAVSLGAPLSAVGRELIDFEYQLERYSSEVSQANAVPLATRKLMLFLPALGVFVGQLAGFGTVQALIKPVGVVAILLAAVLIWVGVRWSNRMMQPMRQTPSHPGLSLMRLNLALASGQPLHISSAYLDAGVAELFKLSKRTGAPLIALISNEIQLRTNRAQQQAMSAAKELSVKLLIPLGVTVMPAFLILTVVPLLIGIGLK